MNELRRRRGIPGRVVPVARRPRRVGEPNVLSDAATPNVLSTQAGGLQAPAVSRATQPVLLGQRSPTQQAGQGWLATGQAAAPSRVRLPSIGTLIFLGFVAITAIRLIGQFASGVTTPTSEPIATSAAAPGASAAPGPITFGTGQSDGCAVLGEATVFGPTADVWWYAELSTVQTADAAVVVIVRRNGVEVDREAVPPDPSYGKWTVLCAGEPLRLHDPGAYRVEVWNEEETALYAMGEYRVGSS